jgi:folate-dependent tRNA-U54 methylase TrmFO/GidA
MNANFGLLPEVAERRKRDRKDRKAEVALAAIRGFNAVGGGHSSP